MPYWQTGHSIYFSTEYGITGIKNKEIIKEMEIQHNAVISEESIILEKPIKEIGEFEIQISIKDKKSSFKLKVERV